jgi:hypothetical protein
MARTTAGVLLCAAAGSVAIAQPVIRVDSKTIAVDPKTHDASVKFINTGTAPAQANISLQANLPPGADITDPASATSKSLVSWVQQLPKQVKLAPHETLTVKLHLEVPSSVSPGDYSAYVVASTSGGNASASNANVNTNTDGNDDGTVTMSVSISGAGGDADDDKSSGGSGGISITPSATALKVTAAPSATQPAANSVSVGKLVYHAGKK